MTTPTTLQAYRRAIKAGYTPYFVRPRLLANSLRALFGLPLYRSLGGWLPPQKAV